MSQLVASCLFLAWIRLKGVESLKVSITPDITAVIGSSNVQIKCNFTLENNEYVDRIMLKVRNKTSVEDFFQVATFYRPPRQDPPTLTARGQYLSGRVKLDNPTDSSNVAVLSFSEVQCIDDTDYRCDIPYEISGEQHPEMSNPTKLTITSKPSKPDNITSNSTLDAIFDGQFVSFTCKGNVGKPPGKYIYRKYRYNENYPLTLSDVVTTSEEDSEKCTFYGTSNLTIKLNYLDNKATITCVEQSFESLENMTLHIGPINVNWNTVSGTQTSLKNSVAGNIVFAILLTVAVV